MAEPAGIYSPSMLQLFDPDISLTDNIILSQGRCALLWLRSSIDDLYTCLANDKLVSNMYVDPKIPYHVQTISHFHGLASTILLDNSERRKEKKELTEGRMRRYDYIRRFSNGAKFETLSNRKIRNALTHMDDYLTVELQRPNTSWCFSAALLTDGSFAPPNGQFLAYFQTYIADLNCIDHLGYRVSLTDLRSEAESMLACVFGIPSVPPPQRPRIVLNLATGIYEKK